MTLSINDTQHNWTLSITMLYIMLSVTMLNVIMLNVTLITIMLNIVMLFVVAPMAVPVSAKRASLLQPQFHSLLRNCQLRRDFILATGSTSKRSLTKTKRPKKQIEIKQKRF